MKLMPTDEHLRTKVQFFMPTEAEVNPSDIVETTKPRQYCDICGAGPYLPSGLGSHKKTAHNIDGTSVTTLWQKANKVGRPKKIDQPDEECPYCKEMFRAKVLNVHISHGHPGKPLVNPSNPERRRTKAAEMKRKARAEAKEAKNANGASSNSLQQGEVDAFTHGYTIAWFRKELEAIASRTETDLKVLTAIVKRDL